MDYRSEILAGFKRMRARAAAVITHAEAKRFRERLHKEAPMATGYPGALRDSGLVLTV
jgi:hypothetical protein